MTETLPGKETPWTETPPGKNMGPGTKTPQKKHGKAARQEVISYRDPLPLTRMTDGSENITLPQTSYVGGKNAFVYLFSFP